MGDPFVVYKNPAMTYFHMGKPHTIIGAEWFHFRVRDGIGWYPNAVVAGRTGVLCRDARRCAALHNKLESRCAL